MAQGVRWGTLGWLVMGSREGRLGRKQGKKRGQPPLRSGGEDQRKPGTGWGRSPVGQAALLPHCTRCSVFLPFPLVHPPCSLTSPSCILYPFQNGKEGMWPLEETPSLLGTKGARSAALALRTLFPSSTRSIKERGARLRGGGRVGSCASCCSPSPSPVSPPVTEGQTEWLRGKDWR